MQTLLPYQEEAVLKMASCNTLLADDCGVGKTVTAVEAGKRYAKGPILVITPRPVKDWWAHTIREQDAGFVGVTRQAGRGVPYERIDTWQRRFNKPLWVITHPEAVRLSWKALSQVRWDWIISDEAHRFKNRKAQQTKALWKIGWGCRRIAMTATPYGKSPADMWALLHWLYPKQYTSYWEFFGKYVNAYQPPGRPYKIIKGPMNLKALGKEIAPFYLRRTKEEVLDLPSLSEYDIPLTMAPKQEVLYETLRKDAYAELSGQEVVLENALVRLLRLQQCALDPQLMVEEDAWAEIPTKVAWLQAWLEDHPNEGVVIVSRFRKFVDKWLRDLAPDACIVGGMPNYQIEDALATFQRTGRLVGSLAAVCEGLNLQRASTLIIMDGTWSLVQDYQLRQRIHRLGSTKPCQVLNLVALRTVDGLLRKGLKRKWSQSLLLEGFIKEVQRGD